MESQPPMNTNSGRFLTGAICTEPGTGRRFRVLGAELMDDLIEMEVLQIRKDGRSCGRPARIWKERWLTNPEPNG
jgi:hypothetical protein